MQYQIETYMDIEDIKRIIAGDETRTLELKKTTGELKDGMHSACAFLNTDGGWLIFGIAPTSLKVLGQVVTDKTRQEIANALTGFSPSIDVKVEYIDVPDSKNGEQVIAMYFNGWVRGKHPYVYHGCPYYKPESITKQMPQDMYDERIKESDPHKFAWENKIADGWTINDLDEKRIREAVNLGVESGRLPSTAKGAPVEEILAKFDLMVGNQLKNAAVMLFAKSANGYPQLLVRMARFRGTDKNEFRDNQRAKGNFFDLLDAGMAFCFKHLDLSGKIVGLRREEHLEIPTKALREALVNAYCHRSYDQPGESVSIGIYNDRVEIANPGQFPNDITIDSIKLPHHSHPYNPTIADVLYLSTYLESWGSGAKRIMDECKSQNIKEPDWYQEGHNVVIKFTRKNMMSGEQETTNRQQTDKKPTANQQQTDSKPTASHPQKLVLKELLDGEKALSELMIVCGYKDRDSFRKSVLNEMLEHGWVAMTHPEVPYHKNQRYIITEEGKKENCN